jgi:predicted acylesterase/phospholipase RssA
VETASIPIAALKLPTAGQAQPTGPPRGALSVDQITHLALEGGGGKGLAFLGAIKALHEIGVINYTADGKLSNPVGISGSSAGAITAMLLASGMDFDAIKSWMSPPGQSPASAMPASPGVSPGSTGQSGGNITGVPSGTTPATGGGSGVSAPLPPAPTPAPVPSAANANFSAFFDPATPRCYWSGKPVQPASTPEEQRLLQRLENWPVWAAELAGAASIGLAIASSGASLVGDLYSFPKPQHLGDALLALYAKYVGGTPPSAMAAAMPAIEQRLAWLGRDLGIFAGAFAYETFNALLSALTPGSGDQPVTFNDHYAAFHVDLAITGSNLSTGKTVWFRPDLNVANGAVATGRIPVAAAVRASMSLPFVFKPVIFDDVDPDITGVYVDGGVWNNTPVAAFDHDLNNPTTLVLRLGVDTTEPILGFGQFVARYVGLTAGGSGETQFDVSRAFQAITLAADGLSTFEFSPDPAAEAAAVNAAYNATFVYFNMTPGTPPM